MSRYQKSAELFQRAQASLAGGVSSNVRALAQPQLYFRSASGARLVDADENVYLDFTLSQGPMFLGHSPPAVLDAVERAMRNGQLYGAQHDLEIELAESIQRIVPCAELARFCNSGSEAVHAAIRVARAHTGRDKILKFEGHYHGWYDELLVSNAPALEQAGPREGPKPVLASRGQLASAGENVMVLPWNDADILQASLQKHGSEIAALIMEPVMCNNACIPPQPGYLEMVRELCAQYGIILIFDEVITGFRLALGGAQSYFGITPDLATFGKAMANGFPIACLAGRRELLELIASLKVNHSGTYNSNVMVTAAAHATIAELERLDYQRIHRLGEALMNGLRDLAAKFGLPVLIQGYGPAFHLAFTERAAFLHYRDSLEADGLRNSKFVGAMLDRGIRLLSRGLWYLSAAHTEADIQSTLETVEDIWRERSWRQPA
ncbi:MAG: aspartate aminotransferase family protein [Chloroflexi bacterium]|nr:aspartate aminotransferase family protein [Chloroflexota bacterium]